MRARWSTEEQSSSHLVSRSSRGGFPADIIWYRQLFARNFNLTRLTKSVETGVPFEEINSAPSSFVTNVFHCDRNGFAHRIDNRCTGDVWSTGAHVESRKTVRLLAEGKLKFVLEISWRTSLPVNYEYFKTSAS
jgi:hypothetical protein